MDKQGKNIVQRRLLFMISLMLIFMFLLVSYINDEMHFTSSLFMGVSLLLVNMLLYKLEKPRLIKVKGKRVKQPIGINYVAKVVQLAICIFLIVGSWTSFEKKQVFGWMKGYAQDRERYSVLVESSDKAKSLYDLNNSAFGYMSDDAHRINDVVENISSSLKQSITPRIYSTHKETLAALYSTKIQVLIINEKDRSDFEKIDKDFSRKTKVIKSYII
jgi:hypothetical protein